MYLKKIAFVVAWCLCLKAHAQMNLLEKAKSYEVIDSSIHYAEKFIKESSRQKDTLSVIEGGVYLAIQYFNKSKYKEVENIINQTLVFAILKKDIKQQAILNLILATSYSFEGDNTRSLSLFLKVYDLYEKLDNPKGVASCVLNLAEFYRKIREYNEAIKYIRKGFTLYQQKKIADTSILISLNNRLAAIMIETGRVDSSIYYSDKAIVLSQKINDRSSEAISLNEKGYAFKNSNRPDSAIRCYQIAETIWNSIGADKEALGAMRNRAMLYSAYHYPKKLIFQTYSKIVHLVHLKKIDFSLEDVYSDLAKEYLTIGDTSRAFIYQQKYYDVRMETLKRIYDLGITNIKEKYENNKIKRDFSIVSSKLEESEIILSQKKRENLIIYTFITLLSLLVLLVVYLLYRLYRFNKSLKQKNTEKDILIQEIHHRVKNNLQFVSSLINMQINSSDNSAEAYSLNDASRRIKAMALVHEMLYSQNELQGINIEQYLLELVDSINELVNSKSIPIRFNVNVSGVVFDTQRAIAIGMITSELVSNSIKYAFSNTQDPTITILLVRESDKIVYSVQDNGGGMQETVEQREKMGMRLVSIFSRQLKGEHRFENINGCKFIVSFKY